MMTPFQAFEAQARQDGFDEVLERRCTRHLHAGDTFMLARDVPHTERYGPDGATYWVARRP